VVLSSTMAKLGRVRQWLGTVVNSNGKASLSKDEQRQCGLANSSAKAVYISVKFREAMVMRNEV
jgi:hypothetical protein